jgi:hypothetical protein
MKSYNPAGLTIRGGLRATNDSQRGSSRRSIKPYPPLNLMNVPVFFANVPQATLLIPTSTKNEATPKKASSKRTSPKRTSPKRPNVNTALSATNFAGMNMTYRQKKKPLTVGELEELAYRFAGGMRTNRHEHAFANLGLFK